MTITPNPNSATTMNNIVIGIQNILSSENDALSIQEFALGQPSVPRTIDLNFGLALIDKFSLGKGIVRFESTQFISYSGYTININTLLGSRQLQNCYAIGSVYLSPQGNPASLMLSASLAKGSSDINSLPIFLNNDLDSDSILAMLNRNELPQVLASSDSVEISKFIVDITSFNNGNDSVKLLYSDKRLPRGWAGYAEETMSTELTPYIINYNSQLQANVNYLENALKTLVSKWIYLTGWKPNFITYWTTNGRVLPPVLKKYIETSFGVNF